MTIFETVQSRLSAAMKAKNATETSILRVALGELQRAAKIPGDEEAIRILRKLLEGNRERMEQIMKAAKPETSLDSTSAIDSITKENAILESLLPKTLNQAEIEAFFTEAVIAEVKAAKSDGQATGIVMKAIKTAGKIVNGADVQAVVKKVRA